MSAAIALVVAAAMPSITLKLFYTRYLVADAMTASSFTLYIAKNIVAAAKTLHTLFVSVFFIPAAITASTFN